MEKCLNCRVGSWSKCVNIFADTERTAITSWVQRNVSSSGDGSSGLNPSAACLCCEEWRSYDVVESTASLHVRQNT
jgi:hypothetical protein